MKFVEAPQILTRIMLLLPVCAYTFATAPPAPHPSMPLVFPLVVEDASGHSSLVMVNSAAIGTYVDVEVRSLGGALLTRKRITFIGHSQQNARLFHHSVGQG